MVTTAALAMAAAFGVSAWSAVLLSRAGAGSRFLDRPNERSLHQVPVPRTGGLAVLAGLASGAAVLLAVGGRVLTGMPADAWLAGAALALAAVSLLDDWKGISPAIRLAVHLAACAAAALALHLFAPRALFGLLAVVALAWFVNLYNFMDGMDGLAGSMTVIGCAVLAIGAGRAGDLRLAIASLVVAAATAGFLVSNLPPARVFLGDVGSIPLGFFCGVLSLTGVSRGDFRPWFPILVFAPFLFDATATLARRLLAGEAPWRAHRDHLYQRLVLKGWSQGRMLAWAVALMLAAGSAALWLQP
jgi:UDP-GlcNAc:undecaprenyl-phosphate/decaprenyl-phosphate GlcNAc-1-phosphate transferase